MECKSCKIPQIDKVKVSISIDASSFIPAKISKPDCVIYYETAGTCLMECKTAYIKRAVYQFESFLTFLLDKWDAFLFAENLPKNLPFPNRFILYMEKGIGKEHYTYEIEKNTKRLKVKKDGYTKILNRAYIEVYSQRDLDNMKRNLHNFGGG